MTAQALTKHDSPESLQWLSVEASSAVQVLPVLRSADALCCNSYIIRSGSLLLVIDPGAHPEQTDFIRKVLEEELAARQRPVVILLTHCHHDHSRSLEYWRTQTALPVILLAHEEGAAVLLNGDSSLTLAYLFSQTFPSIDIDVPIGFSGSRPENPAADEIGLSRIADFQVADVGFSVKHHHLRLAEDVFLEMFQTPGHSPDSLCFCLGGYLFTGDVLLADKPGVAGIPGWSQPQLLETLGFLEWLLATRAIHTCCPGHGRLLSAVAVLDMLKSARAHAEHLNRLVCFDAQRLEFLKTCAVVLAREAALQFAVLGGKLHLLAHRLDTLGEEELAQAIMRDIDLDGIETYLEQFRDFAEKHALDALQFSVPLRGVIIMEKIRSMFSRIQLPEGIATMAVRGIELLLRDYINIVAGLDLLDFLQDADAQSLVQQALHACKPAVIEESELDEAADDPVLFGAFLSRRLYPLPELCDFEIRLPVLPVPPVKTDPERIILLFADIIEQLSCMNTGRVVIIIKPHEAKKAVMVCFERPPGAFSLSDRKARYYAYIMEMLGGTFSQEIDGRNEQACFYIPSE